MDNMIEWRSCPCGERAFPPADCWHKHVDQLATILHDTVSQRWWVRVWRALFPPTLAELVRGIHKRRFLYISICDMQAPGMGEGVMLSFSHTFVAADSADEAYLLGQREFDRAVAEGEGAFLNDYVVEVS